MRKALERVLHFPTTITVIIIMKCTEVDPAKPLRRVVDDDCYYHLVSLHTNFSMASSVQINLEDAISCVIQTAKK